MGSPVARYLHSVSQTGVAGFVHRVIPVTGFVTPRPAGMQRLNAGHMIVRERSFAYTDTTEPRGLSVLLLRALLSDRYVLAGLTMIALGSSLIVAALMTWGA